MITIRNILSILGVLPVVTAISRVRQGNLESDFAVSLGIYIFAVILLWIPIRIVYRVKPIKAFDGMMFKYAWYRRILKDIVGKKEYAEMEQIHLGEAKGDEKQ